MRALKIDGSEIDATNRTGIFTRDLVHHGRSSHPEHNHYSNCDTANQLTEVKCCTVVKDHAKFNRNIVSRRSKHFIWKLCTVHMWLCGRHQRHVNFGSNWLSGVSTKQVEYNRCVTFWLSWCTFFSNLRPGRTVGPIFTVHGSDDVLPRKKGCFRRYNDGTIMEIALKSPKWA